MTASESSVHPLFLDESTAPSTLVDLVLRRNNSASRLTLIQARGAVTETNLARLIEGAYGRLAQWQAQGTQVGDSVILLCEDRLAFLEAFWAATLGGLVAVPVSGGISDEHRAKILRIAARLHAPWLFTDDATLKRLVGFVEASAQASTSSSGKERDDDGDVENFNSTFATLAKRVLTSEAPVIESGDQAAHRLAQLHAPSPEDVALIQFSSGSTNAPKGVVLTHQNLLVNLNAILTGMDMRADDRMMSWMPLTHDMGLIGFHLTPVTAGIDHLLMATDVFVRRPALWLEAASEHRATVLCSPNFGYEHYLKSFKPDQMQGKDLSSVRLVFNGAEPISAALIRRFNASLSHYGLSDKAMFPVYGLAEASLAVCFPPIGRPVVEHRFSRDSLGVGQVVSEVAETVSAASFVSVGNSIPDVDVRIADADGNSLPDGYTGHLLIRGKNVTAGYLVDVASALDATCIDADGWLDTGDLAVVFNGEIHVTGRAKDILFANGQNLYPHDLEHTLTQAGVVEVGKLAVAAVPAVSANGSNGGSDASSDQGSGDEICVFVLHRAGADAFVDVRDAVRRELAERTGVRVDRVIPVPRIPKTTSGKVQRFKLVESLVNGEFDAALAELPVDPATESTGEKSNDLASALSGASQGDDTADSIAARLLALCNARIADREVHPDDNLFELGISSLTLAEIHADIENVWPDALDITDLFDYPTVTEIATVLEQRTA